MNAPSNTFSALPAHKHLRFSLPRDWGWAIIVFVSLWSPIIHLVRWTLTPDEHSYCFFLNQDLADWHYILKSADNGFLSIHDVQSRVLIWLRPDCHSLLFFPFILIGKWFSLSSSFLLMTVDVLGNLFCAFATFFFFQTLFNDECKSWLAFSLVYFTSGVTGLVVLSRWLWLGDLGLALSGWVGENHSLGYDLMEGNMVHWTTILFRPYYLFPRAFGLLSIALLYDAYRSPNRKNFLFSALCLFAATLIHPQSGLIYGAMAGILLLTQLFREDWSLIQRVQPALWTIGGLLIAAICWKLYQRIPAVDEAAKEYLKRMYNADSLPLFFALAPMLIPTLAWTLRKTTDKAFSSLLLFSVAVYGVAVSEWFIRDERVALRVGLLGTAFVAALVAIIWKREHLFKALRLQEPKAYLGFCAIAIAIIALSPHHDGLKALTKYESLFGALTPVVQSFLQTLSLIYAAPFRLGVAVPLAGLLAILVFDFPIRLRRATIVGVFSISAISISLYLFLLFSSKAGYLKDEEREAMLFLKNLDGKNVMCSGESSQFIIQLAQKHTLVGGVAGVLNLNERQRDLSNFFSASDVATQQEILKKYAIDYVYIGNAERSLIRDNRFLTQFPLVFENRGAKIYRVY